MVTHDYVVLIDTRTVSGLYVETVSSYVDRITELPGLRHENLGSFRSSESPQDIGQRLVDELNAVNSYLPGVAKVLLSDRLTDESYGLHVVGNDSGVHVYIPQIKEGDVSSQYLSVIGPTLNRIVDNHVTSGFARGLDD